jgi:hypothetical protein
MSIDSEWKPVKRMMTGKSPDVYVLLVSIAYVRVLLRKEIRYGDGMGRV